MVYGSMLLLRSIRLNKRLSFVCNHWRRSRVSVNDNRYQYYSVNATIDTKISHAIDAYELPLNHLIKPSSTSEWNVVTSEDLKHVKTPKNWDKSLEELQKRLGVHFHNTLILKTALIHHSVLNIPDFPVNAPLHRISNRSLEFLGDSILGMVVASSLYQKYPNYAEGELTKTKADLVNNNILSAIATEKWKLDQYIVTRIGKGSTNGLNMTDQERKAHRTVTAGTVEAVIAAVYLDQGLPASIQLVYEHILPYGLKYLSNDARHHDDISELQILLQGYQYGHPVYKNVPAPIDSSTFTVELHVQGKHILSGEGSSYQEARLNAARKGLVEYRKRLKN